MYTVRIFMKCMPKQLINSSPNYIEGFKNAPFFILCLFHMIDLRMFSLSFFYPLANWTMVCHDFDLLMLFILT